MKLVAFEDTESCYQLMYNWCSNEFVYKWFEQRKLSLDEVTQKYRRKLAERKQKLFLIYLEGEPIGYTQIYRYDGKKYSELSAFDIIYEFDIFIGNEKYLSRGFGTAAVNTITDYIFENYRADCIILRPFEENIRAVRCYMKSEFRFLCRYPDHDTMGNPYTTEVLYRERQK